MEFERFAFASRRSNVVASNGLVATSQPLAAQAGLDILKGGGNALDAAIATAATLCVVEPTSTGVGGDAFALIWWEADRTLYGLNASGPAPLALRADQVRALGHATMPWLGGLSVTVPGSVRGWQAALERFGSRSLDTLLRQPLAYASGGFPVSQRIAAAWQRSADMMRRHPDSRRVWLPGGRAPRAGELFRNPEFAATLQVLSEQGPDAFYQGDIARQIAACVQADGGCLTEQDLADFQPEWVTPISTAYGDGFRFYEIPPNGQGLTALLALNIAREFDLQALGYGTIDYFHALAEAIKLAFADALIYIADPRQAAVPLEGLLSRSYAQARRRLIKPESALTATAGRPPKRGDTVYLTVADGAGNMVSWIQSLYDGFGSGLTTGQTGIQLQNRAANFSLQPGHANEAAPGKRPYHTIIPGFITRHGQAWSSFGVMGGFMQPQGHLQVGLNLVEFGMDPQTALDAPRFRWLEAKTLALETEAGDEVWAGLAARGHRLVDRKNLPSFGGGQIIVRDPDSGVLVGGSEPRKDGAAVGW